MAATAERPTLVLDTNILLDVWVFGDAAAAPLISGLPQGQWRWLATPPMREELARVLAYPQIVKSLAHHQINPQTVLDQFDAHAEMVAVAAKASVTCKDPDDQKFIDLAVAHHATLLSKDQAVLCMAKRLLALGVRAGAAIHLIAP
ncbi:MAG: putative toxin-antitoxin system toxin component, PIN family [Burkholderiales bacterium PBB3]|nr:MAG: putative toxin-antitoxin system toxin component, PIN family [Burkholderiales bacterium PBB3]